MILQPQLNNSNQIMNLPAELFQSLSFLEDYDFQGSLQPNSLTKALIKGSNQKVIIHKIPIQQKLTSRFKTLVDLFHESIILADNIFVVQEQRGVFAYIVAVDLTDCSKFKSLKQFLDETEETIELIRVIKVILELIKKVHSKGESCLNLNISNVIIDCNKNVFLSPYLLDQGTYLENVKNQQLPYQRCYLSPELLSQLFSNKQNSSRNASTNRLKINKKMLIKNDYWNMGCILLETFVLETPPFLFVDLMNQQSVYQTLGELMEQWGEYIPTELKGLFYNTLNKIQQHRSIELQNEEAKLKLNSNLTIELIKITDPYFKQQIQIILHLSSKFTFYIQPTPQNQQAFIMIDKSIKINDTEESLSELISTPIKITLKSRLNSIEFEIFIGTLCLKEEGMRVWKESIVSSYKIPGTKSRLKMKFQYKTPGDDTKRKEMEVVEIERMGEEVRKQKKGIGEREKEKIIVKELDSREGKSNQNNLIQNQNLSINQITQYLDKLKEQFKKDTLKDIN